MRGDGGIGLGGIVAALILALGFLVSGWLIASGLVEARVVDREITVTGTASELVKAGRGRWELSIAAEANSLDDTRLQLDTRYAALSALLTAEGIDIAEIRRGIPQIDDRQTEIAGGARGIARYHTRQPVIISSVNVDALAAASQNASDLLTDSTGLNSMSAVNFTLTGAGARQDALEQAALVDARASGERVAADMGVRLVALRKMQVDASADDATSGELFQTLTARVTVIFQVEP